MNSGIAGAESVPPAAKSKRVERGAAVKKPAAGASAEPEIVEPKTRAQPRSVDKEFLDENGNPFVRRVTVGGNPYEIPKEYQRPGWSYEYKTDTVLQQPVDPSEKTAVQEGGWRPVHPSEMPKLVPAGWDRPFIARGGQMLYKRPMALTIEARQEAVQTAEDQRLSKLQGALAGSHELGKVAKRQVDTLDLHGELGVHKQD